MPIHLRKRIHHFKNMWIRNVWRHNLSEKISIALQDDWCLFQAINLHYCITNLKRIFIKFILWILEKYLNKFIFKNEVLESITFCRLKSLLWYIIFNLIIFLEQNWYRHVSSTSTFIILNLSLSSFSHGVSWCWLI